MGIALATKGVIAPTSSGGTRYRMRALDSSLGDIVFWFSSEVDDDGSDYAGPGPLVDIVVQSILPPSV